MIRIPPIGTRIKMNKVNWNPEAEGKTGTIIEIDHDGLNKLTIRIDPPHDHWHNHEYYASPKDIELLIPIARTHQVKP